MMLSIATVTATTDAPCQPRPATGDPAFAALLDVTPPIEEEGPSAGTPPVDGLPLSPMPALPGGIPDPVTSPPSGAVAGPVPREATGIAAQLLAAHAIPEAMVTPASLAWSSAAASQDEPTSPAEPRPSATAVDPQPAGNMPLAPVTLNASPAARASLPSASTPSAAKASPGEGAATPPQADVHADAPPVSATPHPDRTAPEPKTVAPRIGHGRDAIPDEPSTSMTRIIGAAPGRPAEAAVVLIERPAGLPLPTTPPMPAAPPSTLPVLDAAADPAPAAPPSIPPLHGDVAVAQASQVIARHILAADAQGGGRELRFRLAPGTLGTVEVRVEDKPAGVEVRLLADTLAARDHLAAQGGELRQLLDAVQPGPVAVRVELRPERDAGGPWQHAAHDHQPPEQRRRHAFRASQDLTGEEDSGAPAGHTDRIDRRI